MCDDSNSVKPVAAVVVEHYKFVVISRCELKDGGEGAVDKIARLGKRCVDSGAILWIQVVVGCLGGAEEEHECILPFGERACVGGDEGGGLEGVGVELEGPVDSWGGGEDAEGVEGVFALADADIEAGGEGGLAVDT